jgi:galactose mutarotase-like enzyme
MSLFADIADGDARAKIALRGAELKSWTVGGRERIWQGDEKIWPESAPILFPIVGWTRDGVLIEGERYPLGLHGFARDEDFTVTDLAAHRVVLRLKAHAGTRALYPFEFSLYVEYAIQDNVLSVGLYVFNEDEKSLPYAWGLHPGFVWPASGDGISHILRFDQPEKADVPVIAPGGLFSASTRPIPLEGRELVLTPDLFEEALCFLDARSTGLEIGVGDAGGAAKPCLRVELENFPHIAVWSRPNAPFVCLEAWTGHGDPEGFDGDIFTKPSMRMLAPGETARSGARFFWRG